MPIDFIEDAPAIDFQPDAEPISGRETERAARVTALEQARRETDASRGWLSFWESTEGILKPLLSFSPAAIVEQAEKGVEAGATLLTGEPKQLLVKPSEIMRRPLRQIPQVPPATTVPGQIGAGAANAVIDFANFLQTPEGASFLGIGALEKAVQRQIAGVISAGMAAHAPEQFNAAMDAAQRGDIQEASKQTVSFLGQTSLAALAGRTSTRPETTLQEVAPETADAMRAERRAVNIMAPGTVRPQELRAFEPPGPERPAEMVSTEGLFPKTPELPMPPDLPRLDIREIVIEEPSRIIPVERGAVRTEIAGGRPEKIGGEVSFVAEAPTLLRTAQETVTEPNWRERFLGEAFKLRAASGATEFEAVKRRLQELLADPLALPPSTVSDLPSRTETKAFASKPFGVPGRLFDPRIKAKGDEIQTAILTHPHERAIGDSQALVFGQAIKGRLDPAFDVNPETGQILNITPRQEGASRHIADVFEGLQRDPQSYELNPAQWQAWGYMQGVLSRIRDLEKQYGISYGAEGEYAPEGGPTAYFPRVVTKLPKEPVTTPAKGARVGAKQFFQKERLFETEAEGATKGYVYEPSIEKRLTTRLQRLYKAIADKRLIQDPVLEGKTPSQLEANLRLSFAEELATGEITEAKLKTMVKSLQAKGTVWQPGFAGKIYPEETAAALNKAFPGSESLMRKTLVDVNDAIKTVRLGFDIGNPVIQGLPLLARHPALWGKAVGNGMKALTDSQAEARYFQRNLGPALELASMGSRLARLPEFLSGLGEKALLDKVLEKTRIPGAQELPSPFRRYTQTFFDVAKIELWKAYRELYPREEWPEVVQSIESMLGIARMEEIGIGRGQALLERALLMAPSYYRGHLNLLAQLGKGSASGKISRRALAAYGAAGLALYFGVGTALDMDPDNLAERLDPTRGDFMMWSAGTKEFGLGGFYRSLLRLMGNTAKTSVEHPGNWSSLSSEKNPLSRWFRAHAGPVPALVWDQFSGRDFMGEETSVADLGPSVLPLWSEAETIGEAALQFLGINAYEQSKQTQYLNEREKLAGETDYEDLPLVRQIDITRQLNADERFKKEKPNPNEIERAFRNAVERQERVTGHLSKSNRNKLEELGVIVPGYESSFMLGKTDFILTRNQQDRYEQLIVEEYNNVLDLLSLEDLKQAPLDWRQKKITEMMSKAKIRARKRLLAEQEKE